MTPQVPQTPVAAVARQAVDGIAEQQADVVRAIVRDTAAQQVARLEEQAQREAAQAQVAPQIAAAAQPMPPADLVRNPIVAWQFPNQPQP